MYSMSALPFSIVAVAFREIHSQTHADQTEIHVEIYSLF